MRFLGYLFLALLIAGAAAFLTKPGESDAEAVLREEVMMIVAREEIGDGRSTGENLALAACKLRPNDCFELLRGGMNVRYTDETLWLEVELNGYERRATCYGAFGRFFCPGGWAKE